MTCHGSIPLPPGRCRSRCAACGLSPWACWRRCGRTGRESRRALATDSVPAERMDRLQLGPLRLGAIREVLAARTTLSPGRSLLLRIHEASGRKSSVRSGTGRSASCRNAAAGRSRILDVPDSLHRLVLGRVTGLPPGTRDVLLVSSLSAEPALPVICAAAPNPATAPADLDAGIQAGVVADGPRRGRFRSSADAFGRRRAGAGSRAPHRPPPAGSRRAGSRGAGTSPGAGRGGPGRDGRRRTGDRRTDGCRSRGLRHGRGPSRTRRHPHAAGRSQKASGAALSWRPRSASRHPIPPSACRLIEEHHRYHARRACPRGSAAARGPVSRVLR